MRKPFVLVAMSEVIVASLCLRIVNKVFIILAIAESGPGSPITHDFFAEEYRLNCKIGTLGIPIVSLIHGICMGGVCVDICNDITYSLWIIFRA